MDASILKRHVSGPVAIVIALAAWESCATARWIRADLFPPPSDIYRYLAANNFSVGIGFEHASIIDVILASLGRVLAGISIAFVSAVLIAVLFSLSGLLKAFFEPLMRVLAPIAPVAWIPLALALFGIGNAAAIFLVFLGVVFVLTIATLDAIASVPKQFLQIAQTMGATRRQVWLQVILPYILPRTFSLLRLNFFGAWMAVLAAEMVGLRSGLGAMIMVGRESASMQLVFFGMMLIGLTGYAVDLLLTAIQRAFLWWGNSEPWH